MRDVRLAAQSNASVCRWGSYPHSVGAIDNPFVCHQPEQPGWCRCKIFKYWIDPLVPVAVRMNRRRRNDVAAAATEVDSRQDPRSVAEPRCQNEIVIALSGLDYRSPQPFPAGPCLFKGVNCSLAIKINYVEADPGSEADVRCRMI